jgi:hypothetical protein
VGRRRALGEGPRTSLAVDARPKARAQSTDKFSDQRVCGRVVATENMGQRLARAYAELGQFADSWRCIAEGTTAIEKTNPADRQAGHWRWVSIAATACPRDHSRDREAGAHTGADCNARTRARPSADAQQGHREEESSVAQLVGLRSSRNVGKFIVDLMDTYSSPTLRKSSKVAAACDSYLPARERSYKRCWATASST